MNFFIVFYKGKLYRAAGFRVPIFGEWYLSTNGKVKYYSEITDSLIARSIVREITSVSITGDKL